MNANHTPHPRPGALLRGTLALAVATALCALAAPALQAADGAVEVRVTIQNAEARDLPSPVSMGSWVLLEVRDTGPGIPASLMDRLFDPFVTGREGGTGLGLSVVQRAVEAHGGLVFVDSESGAGTVFSVFLPRTKRAEVAA